MFEREDGGVTHIELADNSEVMVVAPATADYLARCAHGRANDLIAAVTLAFTGPVLSAPAMNTNMWSNPATRRNVEILSQEHGWRFVEPGTGELACGWTGQGRMAEPAEIAEAIESLLTSDLEGRRLLIAAGPTVEDIDPVRFLSNRSSGRMGYALADRAARRGAEVRLVTGPTSLHLPAGVEAIAVRSAVEMERAVGEHAADSDALIMAAAVADFRPAEAAEHKIKKREHTDGLSIELVPNPDILAGLGRRFVDTERPLLVGFALETRELLAAARAKLEAKRANVIVANLASDALGGAQTSAVVIDDRGHELEFGAVSKADLADHILDLIRERLDT
jgi:phosphopantothenoylcysteine decarboxylase/phosphopantothenate--cysteine ligase